MTSQERFREYATATLQKHPEITHTWLQDRGVVQLRIPAKIEDGFDVEILVDDDTTIFWGNGHCHFDLDESSLPNLFGLIRDMLSPSMRVQEFYAGRTMYRARLQKIEGGVWSTEQTTALIFWNYFGRRSIKTFVNRTLPARAT